MKIKKLTIKNFRSFEGEHSFNFEELGTGLHQVIGDNQKEPDLGENGTGKTSLFEGAFWILYGKTTENLKAGDIHTWNVKGGSSGTLVFEIDGVEHTLFRQWSPNKLLLDGQDVTQDDVNEMLGMSPEAYQYAVFMSQEDSTPMFFDLMPSQKLSLFNDIMELDYWIHCSERAASKADVIARKVNGLNGDASRVEGKLEQLEEQMDAYSKQSESFEDNRTAEIDMYRDTIDSLHESIARDSTKLKALNKKITTANKGIDKVEDGMDDKIKEIDDLREKLTSHKLDGAGISRDLSSVRRELDKFKEVEGECPHCLQKVSAAHLKKQTKALNEEYNKYNEEKVKIDGSIQFVSKALSEIEAEINANTKQHDKLMGQLEKLEAERKALENSVANGEGEITRIDAKIEDKRKQENPYKELNTKALDTARKEEEKLVELENEIEAQTAKYEACIMWAKSFKEVRLFVIDKSLTTLEVEVNNYLEGLGLIGWKVSFEMEKETKSGTISKGFEVFITSPHNDKPVPWKSWSGGEKQRLRLAGSLGLAQLILSQLGRDSAMLVLDEPTQHLSSIGVEYLLDLLWNKARDDNQQIFIIDHRSMSFGGFESITEVIKDDNGSYIAEAA